MICHLLYQYIEQNWLYCEVGYAPLILWEVCMLTWQQYPWEHLTSYPTHYNPHRLVLILRSHLTGEYVHWFSIPCLHTYRNKGIELMKTETAVYRYSQSSQHTIQYTQLTQVLKLSHATEKQSVTKGQLVYLWREPSNCNALIDYTLFPLLCKKTVSL